MQGIYLLDPWDRTIPGKFDMDVHPGSCWQFLRLRTVRLIVLRPFAIKNNKIVCYICKLLLCCEGVILYRIDRRYAFIYTIKFLTAFLISIAKIKGCDHKTIAYNCAKNIADMTA